MACVMSPKLALLTTTLVLFACGEESKTIDVNTETLEEELLDADGDGYFGDEDCDDQDAQTNPNAEELCDGVDNNCDGQVDEGVRQIYFEDVDGDGFGGINYIESCVLPEGYVPISTDCNDQNATVYPSAPEQCDGIDNNCDGDVDENLYITWYLDYDGDGFGDSNFSNNDCDPGTGYVSNDEDCDDLNAAAFPGNPEVCDGIDNDCDGDVDGNLANIFYPDADGDGYGDPNNPVSVCNTTNGLVGNSDDCNDGDASAYPGATEVCDTIDNNCDGVVDEDLVLTWYLDNDEDTFGDPLYQSQACERPNGYTDNADDCNDASASVSPFAVEICDTIDNNCDGQINEGLDATYYVDSDGDGFGDITNQQVACSQPQGYVLNSDDCNDAEITANPIASEVCDTIDNNCDGQINEGLNADYYLDADGDGFGDLNTLQVSCAPIASHVRNGDDCDDTESGANPVATEICDTIDNNCDGQINEGLDATYYIDADADGYGNAAISQVDCSQPQGYVLNSDDCNDTSGAASPVATEICDGIDNDCNGSTDEGVELTFYLDYDQDGFGDINQPYYGCSQPQFYTTNDLDCDDATVLSFPNASEICDNLDNNCDGTVDENFVTNGLYIDIDNCGTCGNDCSGLVFDNAAPNCDSSLPTPDCGFECDANFFDANANSTDGCECEFISAVDPDFDGIDQNCDGEDGDHALAIHVSSSQGSPTGDGSWGDPVDTINTGLTLAQNANLPYVLVESGNYMESIEVVEGITMMGAMDANFTFRDIQGDPAVVESNGGVPALSASNINTPTRVDGFSFYTSSTGNAGDSTITVLLTDCSDALQFSNNIVLSDDAEDGGDGDLGTDGTTGDDGEVGMDGGQFNCNQSSYDGGAGGTNTCTQSGPIDGGDGASQICPDVTTGGWGYIVSRQDQPQGSDGVGADQGTGGLGSCDLLLSSDCNTCYVDACATAGDDGTPGGDGLDGSGGGGAALTGLFNGTEWVTGNGVSGVSGTDGSGGGGGGAGSGGDSNANCSQNHAGGSGGGGGAGGCAGDGGVAGNGGGSSFAIFVNCTNCSTLPILLNNELTAGDGGNGGDGGDGGVGGLGGLGGIGGASNKSTAFCSRDGGYGGDGGFGGDGGGGGGGAGGNSFAIYVEGFTPDPQWVSVDNELDAGLPGLGGRGGRGGTRPNDGGNGVNGDNGDQNW